MKRSVIVILSTNFDERNEIGGWVEGAIERLAQSIQKRLDSSAAVAVCKLMKATDARANSVLLVEFVTPESQKASTALVKGARVMRLHAALARELDEKQLDYARDSPVFPVIATINKTAVVGKPVAASMSGGRRGRNKNQRGTASDNRFRLSDDIIKAAGSDPEPDFLKCSRSDDPQSALNEYASALVARMRRCPLQDREMTTIALPVSSRTAAAALYGGHLIEVLPLFFNVTEVASDEPQARFLDWIRGKAKPRERQTTYLICQTEAELHAALGAMPRDSKVLVCAPFDLRQALAAHTNWSGRYEEVRDLSQYLAYLTSQPFDGSGMKKAMNL